MYTQTDTAGIQHHNLRMRQHTLKKWPEANDIVFPVQTREEEVAISAPRLDAPHTGDLVPFESTVKSLRHGEVTEADFLPSAFGVSDSIISTAPVATGFPHWILALLFLNALAIAVWLVRRQLNHRTQG